MKKTDKQETKRDKFIRIAELRVNTILDQYRKLGNLANKKNYDYTDADIKKIFGEISKAMNKARAMFSGDIDQKKVFKLKE